MEDSFKNILIGFILFTLFGYLIITAVNDMGTTYGKNLTDVTGGALNVDRFYNNLTNIEDTANTFNERFEKGNVWSAIAGVVVEGVFSIVTDMFILITSPFHIISGILLNVFHLPSIVVSVTLGILIFTILFAVWRLIKIGN